MDFDVQQVTNVLTQWVNGGAQRIELFHLEVNLTRVGVWWFGERGDFEAVHARISNILNVIERDSTDQNSETELHYLFTRYDRVGTFQGDHLFTCTPPLPSPAPPRPTGGPEKDCFDSLDCTLDRWEEVFGPNDPRVRALARIAGRRLPPKSK